MINILLVHPSQLIANLLSSALEDEPELQVIDQVENIDQAWQRLAGTDVDIILLSSSLPEDQIIKSLDQIKQDELKIDVIIAGIDENRENVLKYVEAGAAGYVTKDSAMDDLIDAIWMATQDKAEMPPGITAALINRLSEYAQDFSDLNLELGDGVNLTDRENEVLELLGKNMTNSEISQELLIEVGTVKNHVHNILSKLNVNSRREAANYLFLLRK